MPLVKLLLDECIDRRLAKEIPNCVIKTVPSMGWAGMINGELLQKAQIEFDAFITVDRNLAFQQNLPKFDIAVIVLSAKSNRLQDLCLLVPQIFDSLNNLKPGQLITLGS